MGLLMTRKCHKHLCTHRTLSDMLANLLLQHSLAHQSRLLCRQTHDELCQSPGPVSNHSSTTSRQKFTAQTCCPKTHELVRRMPAVKEPLAVYYCKTYSKSIFIKDSDNHFHSNSLGYSHRPQQTQLMRKTI